MAFQDWGNMIAFFAAVVAFVVFIWGIVRYTFSGAVQVASEISGSQGGVAFGDRNRKQGGWLIIGAIIAAVVIAAWFYLEAKFFPPSDTTQTTTQTTQPAQTVAMTPFSIYDISLNYPSSWNTYSPTAEDGWVTAFQPSNDTQAELLLYDNQATSSLADFVAEVKSQYQQGLQGWSVVSESPTTIPVYDANGTQIATASGDILTASFMRDSTQVENKILLINYNGYQYILNFNAPSANWAGENLDATISNIFSSVTLK